MKRIRLLLVCPILALGVALTALARIPPPFPPEDRPPASMPLWPKLELPTDRELLKRLEAARDYLRTGDYPLAVRQVQHVLDTPEDLLVKPKGNRASWQSIRLLAEQVLEEADPKARDAYRTLYEPSAREVLARARRHGDPHILTDAVRRYRYTPSGETALVLLAGYHLDRGQVHPAARCYEDLLRLTPASRQPVGVLVQATMAFRCAGRKSAAETVWKTLQVHATGGKIQLGQHEFTLADLDRNLSRGVVPPPALADTRVYRGDESRNQSQVARPPLLEPFVRIETSPSALAKSLLSRAQKASTPDGPAPIALPGTHPLAVGQRILCRTPLGVAALDSVTGQRLWETPLELSLESLLRDPARKQQLLRWFTCYRDGLQSLVFENTINGTLSADGQRVYAVEDTALTVPPFMLWEMANGRKHYFSTLKPWLACNRLRAFDLATGKPTWQLGGPAAMTPGEFADVLFLGPPLPLEGQLWVPVEKQMKLMLYALDPATGAVRSSQSLGGLSDKIQMNLSRRCSALHLAAAEGLLVVPTHHGGLVAFDPLARRIVWARTYADRPTINWEVASSEMHEGREQWRNGIKGGAPLIASGRVVLTGPDSQSIRCLRLEDGQPVWIDEMQTGEDEYVAAIHGGVVLVVGRSSCRALNLADGKVRWTFSTPSPSGQGVLCGSTYWLPVREGGLLALDLESSKPPVRLGTPSSPVLGNLIVHQGAFWSQDALVVAAYPDVGKRLLALNDLLDLAPGNHGARLERAQMRLSQGLPREAVDDLRLVLAATDLPDLQRGRARDLLFTSLTQLLARDPARAEPFLTEYLALAAAPASTPGGQTTEARAERTRRHLQARLLVARSHAALGRHREAAELLLGVLRSGTMEWVPSPEDRAVEIRADVQIESTWREMLRTASPGGQQMLRAALAQAGRQPTGAGGGETLLRLARLSDLLDTADRLALLKRLLALNLPTSRVLLLLESLETRLSRPEGVAGLLELRAAVLVRAGLSQDAADCYRRLGRDFASVVVRDGLTGAHFLEQARQDKRLLADFEGPGVWSASRYVVREERVSTPASSLPLLNLADDHGFGSNPRAGDITRREPVRRDRSPSSLAQTVRVAFDPGHRKIVVQDQADNVLWTAATQASPLDPLITSELPGGYLILGSMALVHVKNHLYGLDLLERRLCWSLRLLHLDRDRNVHPGLAFTSQGQLLAFRPDGMRPSLCVGLGGPARPDRVLLTLHDSLVALDPATGQFLWRRGDVPPVELTGNAETVLLMESDPTEAASKPVRAIRPEDGRLVRLAPGLKNLLANHQRLRFLGPDLLLWQTHASDGKRLLRRHDPVTGRDRWKVALPATTTWLDSPLPTTLGLSHEPGTIRLLDLNTGKESAVTLSLGKGRLDANCQHVLLADERRWYVVARSPLGDEGLQTEPARHLAETVPMLMAHGKLFAFDRETGRLAWAAPMPGQVLVRDPLEGVPFLLTASMVYRETMPGSDRTRIEVRVRVLDKRSGKLLFAHEEMVPKNSSDEDRVPYLSPFYTPRLDPLGNWLELSGPAVRIRIEGR